MTRTEDKTISETTGSGADRSGRRADYWLSRLKEGPLDPDEAEDFNTWLTNDPENERQFRTGQSALQKLPLIQNDPRFEDWIKPTRYERIINALYEAREWFLTRRTSTLAWGGAMASIALLGAVALSFIYTSGTPFRSADPTFAGPGSVPVQTSIAEIRDEALPDGSIVTLGAASSIQVSFTDRQRYVALSQGEAYFDVEPDPHRPFIVNARGTLVRVLGTEFNVSLAQDAVDIAVSEGRVEVIRSRGDVSAIRDTDIKHVLTAGQKVTSVDKGSVRPVETVDIDKVATWRRGELVWVDTPLSEIIDDLNRYSENKIVLENAQLGRDRFTLGLQAEEIEGAPALIADSLGLAVITTATGQVVLR